MKSKFIKGHWYKVKDAFGDVWTGQYMGREEGWSCCVCDKGNHAHIFNVWHEQIQIDEVFGFNNYESLAFGTEHLPEIIEDLGYNDKTVYLNK